MLLTSLAFFRINLRKSQHLLIFAEIFDKIFVTFLPFLYIFTSTFIENTKTNIFVETQRHKWKTR
jgi:hypothetical protein